MCPVCVSVYSRKRLLPVEAKDPGPALGVHLFVCWSSVSFLHLAEQYTRVIVL